MKEKHFDELISKGKLTDAARIFAKEYYENGKMGHTRKLLIEKLADKVDRLEQGPIWLGFWDDYRCGKDSRGVIDGQCGKCCLEWLQEGAE